MNQWEIDNLITHLCAMSLFIDGYETDTTDLRNDLQLEVNKICQYFKELGCRIASMGEKERNVAGLSKAEAKVRRIAKLQLPLDFPRLSKGARGKR
jgi:DNA-directed RNA polymerase I subunit RPA49